MSSPTPLAGSVSVAYLQGLLDYLGRQGLDPAALLALVYLFFADVLEQQRNPNQQLQQELSSWNEKVTGLVGLLNSEI